MKQQEEYFSCSVEEVVTSLGTDAEKGLSEAEAQERRARYGENKLQEQKKKSMVVRFLEQFKAIMRKSMSLLNNTQMTVQEISDMLNFPNASYFGTFFRKQMGMSPQQYRNNLKTQP